VPHTGFMSTDTTQQRAILRQSRTARAVRARFPRGTRVTGTKGNQFGTIERHVPGPDAQGGTLVVKWDNGQTGRHTAISLEVVES
jgi:hypothetical protein